MPESVQSPRVGDTVRYRRREFTLEAVLGGGELALKSTSEVQAAQGGWVVAVPTVRPDRWWAMTEMCDLVREGDAWRLAPRPRQAQEKWLRYEDRLASGAQPGEGGPDDPAQSPAPKPVDPAQ